MKFAAAVFILTILAAIFAMTHDGGWSASEQVTLRELSLASLEPLGADPTNRYADDARAAALGRRIFFDTRFSSNGKVSCATCHQAGRQFQDDAALAQGVGTTDRRTMPIAGTAHSPWQFWDGRKDSQWSQALGPLESPVEHGGTRGQYVRLVAEAYDDEYRTIFGGDYADTARVFANIGKAIAAYERTLEFAPARYDQYVATGQGLDEDEVAGLKLFIGKAECTQCHNGPLFTNNDFHNIGVPSKDVGRAAGARKVLQDEFNCRSRYSDATPDQCAELDHLVAGGHELEGAFKTPSLRNVTTRSPYMHAGQLKTIEEVLEHYNRAPAAIVGHSELKPLKLSRREIAQLAAFLKTLESEIVEKTK